jgi:hypothetical protein
MKCYLVRHQHEGVVWAHVFATLPTGQQVEAIAEELSRRHAPGWTTVVEAELYGPGEIPKFAEYVPDAPGLIQRVLGLGDLQFEGTGHVENPEG